MNEAVRDSCINGVRFPVRSTYDFVGCDSNFSELGAQHDAMVSKDLRVEALDDSSSC